MLMLMLMLIFIEKIPVTESLSPALTMARVNFHTESEALMGFGAFNRKHSSREIPIRCKSLATGVDDLAPTCMALALAPAPQNLTQTRSSRTNPGVHLRRTLKMPLIEIFEVSLYKQNLASNSVQLTIFIISSMMGSRTIGGGGDVGA